jgi:uncharacterized circularly permuted ATP-grasp superfamily protein/uncharacterized alpha-E superfamily protein
VAGNGNNGLGRTFRHWDETHESASVAREIYRPLVARLEDRKRPEIRALDERLDATMREMGVTFDIMRDRPWGRRPWYCDLVPQIFPAPEWEGIAAGMRQRMRAFEMFLRDIYGKREILHAGVLPVKPVLGSVFRQRVAQGLPRPGGAFLHLCGAAVCRLPDGRMAFKHHYFGHASGLSYMIQNRRALARVLPQSFGDFPVCSIADAPTDFLDSLHALDGGADPSVVLLTPGGESAVYSEHAFLARRMGIPLVQGGDLLVLNDAVHLKTVAGLRRVGVIYSRLSDAWIDPMVFRRDSVLGVPGLVQCVRQGSVALVNAIGSQLADDRALLPFATAIIGYYLGEKPLMPSLETYWLGDIDQRELVLSELERFTIRPLYGEKIFLGGNGRAPGGRELREARRQILGNSGAFVAQPQDCDALTFTFHNGLRRQRLQDHILFALRRPDGTHDVFPGALTRTTSDASDFTSNELGGGSKDTWVQESVRISGARRPPAPAEPPVGHWLVGSRVAEAFYWVGRYLERAGSLAGMIRVIETLEIEELNPTERTLYRPVWNEILPPLENPAGVTRRTISSAAGRHRLALDTGEPDSVVQAVLLAAANAESVFECLSLEAWGVVDGIRSELRRVRYRPTATEARLTANTRRACEEVARRVPEFFGTAGATMVSDGAWAFCVIGRLLERAVITANAVTSILRKGWASSHAGHEEEIRLSAFLRLLASRDVYRRVYQMRIEVGPLLDLLWVHPGAPRSVSRCLGEAASRLRLAADLASPSTGRTLDRFGEVLEEVRATGWRALLDRGGEAPAARSAHLLERVLDLHHAISDGFLNLQAPIREESSRPCPPGPNHAL